MPKDAELEDLRGRIINVARNERYGLLIIQLGVFLVVGGLVIGVLGGSSYSQIGTIAVVLLGVSSTFVGFFVTAHYAHEYNSLLRELHTARFVRKCE